MSLISSFRRRIALFSLKDSQFSFLLIVSKKDITSKKVYFSEAKLTTGKWQFEENISTSYCCKLFNRKQSTESVNVLETKSEG